MQFSLIDRCKLKSPQQENFNFHKIAARLADNGFNCIPVNAPTTKRLTAL